MQIMKRREAHERGLSKYSTGKPCIYGHEPIRYTASGICCECQAGYAKQFKGAKLGETSQRKVSISGHWRDVAMVIDLLKGLTALRAAGPQVTVPDPTHETLRLRLLDPNPYRWEGDPVVLEKAADAFGWTDEAREAIQRLRASKCSGCGLAIPRNSEKPQYHKADCPINKNPA